MQHFKEDGKCPGPAPGPISHLVMHLERVVVIYLRCTKGFQSRIGIVENACLLKSSCGLSSYGMLAQVCLVYSRSKKSKRFNMVSLSPFAAFSALLAC